MESEPQDDYKRNNTFRAVQVITDVATVRILREPAASDVLQTPRHRWHQHFICLPQHAESKMTLVIGVGWNRKKNTSCGIPKPLFLVSPSLCLMLPRASLANRKDQDESCVSTFRHKVHCHECCCELVSTISIPVVQPKCTKSPASWLQPRAWARSLCM